LGSRTRRARLMTTLRRQAPRHRCGSPLHIALCVAAPSPDPSPFRNERGHPLPKTATVQHLNQAANLRSSFIISGIGSSRTIRARPTSAGLPLHHIETARALSQSRRFGLIQPFRLSGGGTASVPIRAKGQESRKQFTGGVGGILRQPPKSLAFLRLS
jgi:hypothetical protein